MARQSGNFLLQALLAISLIFAFMPFVARQVASRDQASQMYAVTRQMETAATAARIYIRENAGNLPYGQTVLAGNDFADTLEPYGLPLGFVARTALGQDLILVINKNATDVGGYIDAIGGGLSGFRRAELARRLGFYAAVVDGGVRLGIALDDAYSDIVRRDDQDLDNNAFLIDLNMADFSVANVGAVYAHNGEFESFQGSTLSLNGIENGRKIRHNITTMTADKTVFQAGDGGAALAVTRGGLVADSLSVRTIAKFGDAGSITTGAASVYDFFMTAGRTSFTGPKKWAINGNVVAENMNFTVDTLEISSYLNASRGQDVYINPDSLEYNTRSGIEADIIAASNITLRDQTSDELINGGAGAIVLDIRPAGTSFLPDVLVDTIDNGAFRIISRADDNDGATVDCRSIITALDGVYNAKSLAQYIVCQYVYWSRLEKRIDLKQCMLDGKSDCK